MVASRSSGDDNKLAREMRRLHPGTGRHLRTPSAPETALKKADRAGCPSKGNESDDDGDDEDDDDDAEDAASGHASQEGTGTAAPAMAVGESGAIGLRPRRSSVSYKEPALSDLRRPRSPEPEPDPTVPPRVGETIEVEVDEEGDGGEVLWKRAVVQQQLGGGRFKVCVDSDEEFIEEYSLEEEGREWRRSTGKYLGLKRQRRAVEHYKPDLPPPRGSDAVADGLSTRVGPFRMHGGGKSGERRERRERARGEESSTMDDEEEFAHRKARSTAKLHRQVQPLHQATGRHSAPSHRRAGGSLTAEDFADADREAEAARAGRKPNVLGPGSSTKDGDVQPMAVDGSVGWDKVGGLKLHVEALREMVLMPLMYPEVFDNLGVTPPRGVLFHGPPGTGKTLVARALANTCSGAGRPVAFFMRKGADVLSKWVGEAEKQLRLLFQEAHRQQPSIIFFDEIDGLAPIRSSKQDQIHASIVSTLLALMDGLDARGSVILIGATNRIDSLDAALRRPGRFDRELQFSLPNACGREEILNIHTAAWTPKPAPALISELALRTHGFCGADLRALCSEAALRALHSAYPQIFDSSDKYIIDPGAVQVQGAHFDEALRVVTPAAQRSVSVASCPLPAHLAPLLQPTLDSLLERLGPIFPPLADSHRPLGAFRSSGASITTTIGGVPQPTVHRPHLLLCGEAGCGQLPLSAALMHALEHCHCYSLDLPALVADGSRSPQEACAHIFAEARRTSPSVVLIPSLDHWLLHAEPICFSTVLLLVQQLPPATPLLLLGTCDTPLALLDAERRHRLRQLFPYDHAVLEPPTRACRQVAFDQLCRDVQLPPPPPPPPPVAAADAPLQLAPPPSPPAPREEDLVAVREAEETALRSMRMALREVCMRLGSDRRFRFWARPIDKQTEEGRAYARQVGDPMELATLLERVNHSRVASPSDFEKCLRQILRCAERYFDASTQEGALHLTRAHTLLDEGIEMLQELDAHLVREVEAIPAARAAREHRAARDQKRAAPGAAKPVVPAVESEREQRRRRASARGCEPAEPPEPPEPLDDADDDTSADAASGLTGPSSTPAGTTGASLAAGSRTHASSTQRLGVEKRGETPRDEALLDKSDLKQLAALASRRANAPPQHIRCRSTPAVASHPASAPCTTPSCLAFIRPI